MNSRDENGYGKESHQLIQMYKVILPKARQASLEVMNASSCMIDCLDQLNDAVDQYNFWWDECARIKNDPASNKEDKIDAEQSLYKASDHLADFELKFLQVERDLQSAIKKLNG